MNKSDDEFYISTLEDQVKWLGDELDGAQDRYDDLLAKYEALVNGEEPDVDSKKLFCCY